MIDFFIDSYKNVPLEDIVLEFVAFVFGILSVWYAKKENIWVYPTGLICTLITTYLLFQNQYFGDMMMNLYYSIMSIYGWILWSLKKDNETVLHISYTNKKEKIWGVIMALVTMFITYIVYITYSYWGNFFTDQPVYLSDLNQLIRTKFFHPDLEKVQYIDIFTSGLFFTAMYYMANKKIENWTLWIIGDAITVPLYAYRGLGMLSLQYLVFLILAVSGYVSWVKIYRQEHESNKVQNWES